MNENAQPGLRHAVVDPPPRHLGDHREFDGTINGIWDTVQPPETDGGRSRLSPMDPPGLNDAMQNQTVLCQAFETVSSTGEQLGLVVAVQGRQGEGSVAGFDASLDHWGWSHTPWPSEFSLVPRGRIDDLHPKMMSDWELLPNLAFTNQSVLLPRVFKSGALYKITWSEGCRQPQQGYFWRDAEEQHWYVRSQSLTSSQRIPGRRIHFTRVTEPDLGDREHRYRLLVLRSQKTRGL